MKAICRHCKEDAAEREVFSNIVSKDFPEMCMALGNEMIKHLETYHPKLLSEKVNYCKLFNGFLVSNQFVMEKEMEEDVEKMRDALGDQIIEFAPEDEEDEEAADILDEASELLEGSMYLLKQVGDKDKVKGFEGKCMQMAEVIESYLEDEEEDEDEEDDSKEGSDRGDEEETHGSISDKSGEEETKPNKIIDTTAEEVR